MTSSKQSIYGKISWKRLLIYHTLPQTFPFYRHPKSGSFVRPKKVDFGISVIEALKEQYGLGGDGINKEDMYVMSGGNKKKPVEMVGADSILEKQRYLKYTILPISESVL